MNKWSDSQPKIFILWPFKKKVCKFIWKNKQMKMAVNFWKGGEKGKAECPLQGEKKTFHKGTFKNVMLVQVGTDISGADWAVQK